MATRAEPHCGPARFLLQLPLSRAASVDCPGFVLGPF